MRHRGGIIASIVITVIFNVPLNDRLAEVQPDDALAVDEALRHLEKVDPRKAKIVELRYFGGLTIPETAEVLGVSAATVKLDWSMARAWLFKELRDR